MREVSEVGAPSVPRPTAGVLVLEHRRLDVLRRLVGHQTDDVGGGGRGREVVIVLPDLWKPESSRGRVVVGVVEPDLCVDLLDVALAEAERRGGELVVVHSTAPGGDTGLRPDPGDLAGRRAQRARVALVEAAERAQRVRPGPLVDVVVEQGPPVDLLTGMVRPEDVLVIEARRHARESQSPLGPVIRALLEGVSCPVIVVTPGVAATA